MAMELATRRRRRDRFGEMLAAARSVLVPLQGPYTSILVSDAAGTWPYPVTPSTALAIGSVYRALATYSDLIGTLPVQRIRGDERLELPAFVTAPAGYPVGWTDEVGQALWSLLLRGNAYLLVTAWDAEGYPAAFVVLDPDRVVVEVDDTTGALVYSWHGARGDVRLVSPRADELLHVRWQRPPGSPLGLGVLDALGAGMLGGISTAELYANATLANPIPPAVLTAPLRLKKSQAEELQAQWAASVANRANAPAVLSGGVTYQPLAVTPRDVQLIESRRWNATQVAVAFGLPPYLLGGSTGDSLTYSTVEGEMIRLWTTALMPAVTRLERAIGGAWTPRGQRLRFVPDVLLRSQTLDRYNAHKVALEADFLTVDEVRELENRAPMPAAEPAPEPEPEEEVTT